MKIATLFLAFLLTCCATAPGARSPQQAVDAFLQALATADRDIGELFTPDATMFFPLNDSPLRIERREAIAALFVSMFEQPGYKGSVPKTEDVRVEVSGSTAVITFQLKNPNVTSRRTFVLRREAGLWRIAHLHASNVRKE